MKLQLIVKSNNLPKARAKLPRETKDVVAATAFQLKASADPKTPVDTGNLKNNATIGPDYVTWHAPYTGFVNYGTRYMAARPFIDEAVAEVQPMFVAALKALV